MSPQPNAIKTSNVPGLAIGDWQNTEAQPAPNAAGNPLLPTKVVTASWRVPGTGTDTPWFDITDFGGAGDGITDDTDAWAAIVAQTQKPSWKGGTIVCPPGFDSLVQGGIDLDGLENITILLQGGQESGSRIFTTRTDGGPVISAKSSASITLLGGCLFHNGPTDTAAAVVDATGTNPSPTNFLRIERAQLVAVAAAGTQIDLLRLPNNVGVKLEHAFLNGGRYNIAGRGLVNDFLNGLAIDCTTFQNADLAALHNLGRANHIYGGTVFEPLGSGAAGAILQDATIPVWGLKLDAIWMSDSSAAPAAAAFVLNGLGIVIAGSLLDGLNGHGTGIQFNAASDGVVIAGNMLRNWTLGIDKNGEAVTAQIGPNDYTSTTTPHNFAAAGTLYVD